MNFHNFMSNLNKEARGLIVLVVVVSLIVGAFGGVFGSFFLIPSLEKTAWGRNLLGDIAAPINQSVGTQTFEVKENSAVIDVVKKSSPSVVSVIVTKELDNIYNFTGPDPFGFFNFPFQFQAPDSGQQKQKQEVGGGTGFVIDEKGLILTNRHVVLDQNAEYTVMFNDGKKYKAEVLGRDTVNDIAVLKIDADKLPVMPLGDSDKLEIGQTVIAIGNALGEYRNTVTAGVVSGINRKVVAGDGSGSSEVIEEAIQTDAAINPGNSGGPLLNIAGQVIGINTAMNYQGQSIGFAIPVNQAKNVIESVKKYGKIVRPWIGVRYINLNEQISEKNGLKYSEGAFIMRGETKEELAIVPGSPADKAGLKEYDIILEVNGQKLDDEHSLVGEVSKHKPGDEIKLKVFSKDKEKVVMLKLEERK